MTELCAELGLPQPLVSHHLGELRRAGMLTRREAGRCAYYGLGERVRVDGECRELHVGDGGSAASIRLAWE